MKGAIILIALVISSCATLNEDECRTGDWYGLGLKNAKDGRNLLSEHAKACSEYGIAPDADQYTKGIAEGVKSYCTPENGYRRGVAGDTYYNICPIRMEIQFLKKYKIGKKIYTYKNELNRLTGELSTIDTRLAGMTDYSSPEYHQLKNKKFNLESDISNIKKKLIFLRAQSGYDMEDIVDYF